MNARTFRSFVVGFLGVANPVVLSACAARFEGGSIDATHIAPEPLAAALPDVSQSVPFAENGIENGIENSIEAGPVDPRVRDGGSDAGLANDGADGATSGSDGGACGVCDRIWVCNNFAHRWQSELDGRCVNQRNRTALRCDGTLDGTSYPDVGTWSGDPRKIQLKFRDMIGGVVTFDCYPP